MANKTILLNHSFDGKIEAVYDYILDFKKFGEIHPYMKEVTELSKIEPNSTNYEVKEEALLLGFLKTKPIYEVEVIELEAKKHVRYFSHIKGAILLTIDFLFPENDTKNTFDLTERVEIKGNPLLIAYFASILKKAHLQTFENLRKKLKTSK
ncbi:hypothetical protein GCM10027035_33450 [Emticicia sediminis]